MSRNNRLSESDSQFGSEALHSDQRPTPRTLRQTLPAAGLLTMVVTAALITVGVLAIDLTPEAVGISVVVLVLLLIFSGLPVAISMLLAGSLGIWKLSGVSGLAFSLETLPYNALADWNLSVLPMFVLMGLILWRSGISERLFHVARQWVGEWPGGLAIASNFAGAGLAAGSGSTIGISYAVGRIAIPQMLRANYSPSLAVGSVAMAGTLGQIIPPSIILVIYAGVAQTPVGPQLLAGLVPGVLLALAYAALIYVRARLKPELAPRIRVGATWATRFQSLGLAWPVAVIVGVILGGIYTGVFTASEAGAAGALFAIVIGVMLRRKEGFASAVRPVLEAATATASVVAAIMLLFVGVSVLTRALALSRLTDLFTEWVVALELNRVGLLVVLMILYLVLGMFLDALAIMLLTVPILQPVLMAYDVDMLWFGVFLVILMECAMVTPPLGILTFVMHNLAQDEEVNVGRKISLADVFLGCAWFVGVCTLVIGVLIVFPDIVTWLPSVSSSNE